MPYKFGVWGWEEEKPRNVYYGLYCMFEYVGGARRFRGVYDKGKDEITGQGTTLNKEFLRDRTG